MYSIDLDTNQRLNYLQAIPHFERLWQRSLSLLPRHVFRVFHNNSAGQIMQADTEGGTGTSRIEFWLQGHKEQADEDMSIASTCITRLSREDVSEMLQGHMLGRKHGAASRWISTTDSFELAINCAERHRTAKCTDIPIYIIDTHFLLEPALPLLMFLAMRAWDTNNKNYRFVARYFEYGSLTEWLFWDKIVVKNAVRIDYDFLHIQSEALKLTGNHICLT